MTRGDSGVASLGAGDKTIAADRVAIVVVSGAATARTTTIVVYTNRNGSMGAYGSAGARIL